MNSPNRGQSKWWTAAGVFLLVLAVYILSGPGRIDTIDGQNRFNVTYHWLVQGRPTVDDTWIPMGFVGRDGRRYSSYGVPGSLFPIPLVALGLISDTPIQETSRFLFSFTSAFFGAGIAAILFFFYLELGLTLQQATCWAMVGAFTTLMWPSSASAFDNTQRAFFILASAYFGFLSAKRKSRLLAMLGGLMTAVLLTYQEFYLLVVPALALCTVNWSTSHRNEVAGSSELPRSFFSRASLFFRSNFRALVDVYRSALRSPGEARESCVRYMIWSITAASAGLSISFGYNYLRFGALFNPGKNPLAQAMNPLPTFGNPIAGFATLFLSPGKSIFLYSPPTILAFLGWTYLYRRNRELALGILGSSGLLVVFLSCLAFPGGDWCWGPRYLVLLLPLWAVGLPFAAIQSKIQRAVLLGVIALGLVVQVLALTVENQRFFFERGLKDHFWAEDQWFYFKHSALIARVGETVSLSDGVPPTAVFFSSITQPGWLTYAILGPPAQVPRNLSPQWMRNFKIYYLPRPWPLWMSWIKPGLRPINLATWLSGLFATFLAGSGLVLLGLRMSPDRSSTPLFTEQKATAG